MRKDIIKNIITGNHQTPAMVALQPDIKKKHMCSCARS